jgi:hypothetical protein
MDCAAFARRNGGIPLAPFDQNVYEDRDDGIVRPAPLQGPGFLLLACLVRRGDGNIPLLSEPAYPSTG